MSTATGKWNILMNNHFTGCSHTGSMPDPHRNRTINAYLLPGDEDNLGFTDGVDAWVAPMHNYLKRLQTTKNSSPPTIERRRITFPIPETVTRRRIVINA